MKLVTREVNDLLDLLSLSRSRLGEHDWHDYIPDVIDRLRSLIGDDDLAGEELLHETATRLVREYVHRQSPPIPKDTAQLALFYEPDALLALGESQVIRMAEARAPHIERWRSVLTTNFQAQSSAYFGRMSYIDDRLERLRADDLTLADVEHGIEIEA